MWGHLLFRLETQCLREKLQLDCSLLQFIRDPLADQAQRGGVPLFGEPLQQNIVVSKAVAFGFF